jgi:hypothetical protein
VGGMVQSAHHRACLLLGRYRSRFTQTHLMRIVEYNADLIWLRDYIW